MALVYHELHGVKAITQRSVKRLGAKSGDMAYDPGAIDATLAAAVGDEPVLIAELRLAFVDSAERAILALEAAVGEADWAHATARLKGLAASFGAVRLMALAAETVDRPGDLEAISRLRRAVARL